MGADWSQAKTLVEEGEVTEVQAGEPVTQAKTLPGEMALETWRGERVSLSAPRQITC